MKHELKQLQIEKASIADDEHNEIIKTMTPQEKAEELVFDKFYLVNSESIKLETGEYDLVFSLSLDDAKQCALIAVNEIISIKLLWYQKDTEELNYWQEVKQEIEKL